MQFFGLKIAHRFEFFRKINFQSRLRFATCERLVITKWNESRDEILNETDTIFIVIYFLLEKSKIEPLHCQIKYFQRLGKIRLLLCHLKLSAHNIRTLSSAFQFQFPLSGIHLEFRHTRFAFAHNSRIAILRYQLVKCLAAAKVTMTLWILVNPWSRLFCLLSVSIFLLFLLSYPSIERSLIIICVSLGRLAKELDLLRRQSQDKWPPNIDQDEEPHYYLEIQRREREKMAQNQERMEENSVIFPSAMSQFEVDTIGNSSVHNTTVMSSKRQPPDNLR